MIGILILYIVLVICLVKVSENAGKKIGYKDGHKNGYMLGVSDTESCVCNELNEAYNIGFKNGKVSAQSVSLVVERKHQEVKKVTKKKTVKKAK